MTINPTPNTAPDMTKKFSTITPLYQIWYVISLTEYEKASYGWPNLNCRNAVLSIAARSTNPYFYELERVNQ